MFFFWQRKVSNFAEKTEKQKTLINMHAKEWEYSRKRYIKISQKKKNKKVSRVRKGKMQKQKKTTKKKQKKTKKKKWKKRKDKFVINIKWRLGAEVIYLVRIWLGWWPSLVHLWLLKCSILCSLCVLLNNAIIMTIFQKFFLAKHEKL